MTNRIYPRTVWVLMPSFKPMAVEVVARAYPWSGEDWGDETAKGKRYRLNMMHETKDLAISVGRAEVERQRADIAKRTETMNKRIAALDKAEKNNP